MMLALKCMDVIGYKRPKNNKGRQINFRKGVIVTAKIEGLKRGSHVINIIAGSFLLKVKYLYYDML